MCTSKYSLCSFLVFINKKQYNFSGIEGFFHKSKVDVISFHNYYANIDCEFELCKTVKLRIYHVLIKSKKEFYLLDKNET